MTGRLSVHLKERGQEISYQKIRPQALEVLSQRVKGAVSQGLNRTVSQEVSELTSAWEVEEPLS